MRSQEYGLYSGVRLQHSSHSGVVFFFARFALTSSAGGPRITHVSTTSTGKCKWQPVVVKTKQSRLLLVAVDANGNG